MKTSPEMWLPVCLLLVAAPSVSFAADSPPPAPAGASATRQDVSADAPVSALWLSDPVLLKLTAFYQNTTDFTASFKQVVNTKSPKRTFKRGGSVFFKRPGLMRWDYSVPDAVYYVSDGNFLWAYDAEDRSAIKMRVRDSELYSSLGFISGTTKLSDSFIPDVKPSQTAGFSSVVLIPLDQDGNFKSLTLLVNNQTGEVTETEIIDPLGNVSKFRFESPRYAPIPAKAFEFKVPSGVRVQDLTKETGKAAVGR